MIPQQLKQNMYDSNERFHPKKDWVQKPDRKVAEAAKQANTGLSIVWIMALIAGAIFVLKMTI